MAKWEYIFAREARTSYTPVNIYEARIYLAWTTNRYCTETPRSICVCQKHRHVKLLEHERLPERCGYSNVHTQITGGILSWFSLRDRPP